MAIQRLSLVSFRNHKKQEFEFNSGLTVIWGENGAGKTATLEAIHMLSLGKSFRNNGYRELIREGDDNYIVRGDFNLGGVKSKIAAQGLRESKQEIKLNGKKIISRRELIGKNNVVVLSPELQIITSGAPAERRQFFDRLFSVSSDKYVDALQKYNRVLKQRNAALQLVRENKKAEEDLLVWMEPLVESAILLWSFRFDFLQVYKKLLKDTQNKYDKTIQISIKYLNKKLSKETYVEIVNKNLKKDIVLGRTTNGPHRDDIQFFWDGSSIRKVGSQGEHKLALLLLKITEMSYIRKNTGSHPTLLLDDLFAKLDLERCQKTVSLLQGLESSPGEPVQTIVTTTDLLNIEKSGLLSKQADVKTYHLQR